jgi:hypothetical protein
MQSEPQAVCHEMADWLRRFNALTIQRITYRLKRALQLLRRKLGSTAAN